MVGLPTGRDERMSSRKTESANAASSSRRDTRKARRRILVMWLVGVDAVAVLVAALCATWIRFGSMVAPVDFESPELSISFFQLAIVVVPLWLITFALGGLYDPDKLNRGLPGLGRIIRSASLGVVALILVTYGAKLPGLSRAWTLLLWGLSMGTVVTGRLIVNLVMTIRFRRGLGVRPALVVGNNSESGDIIRIMRANRTAGFVPIGCVASSQAQRLELDFCSGDVPVLGAAREITRIVAESGAHAVVIAASAFDHDVLARILAELRDLDVDVHLSSGLFEVLSKRVLVTELAGVPVITVKGLSLSPMNLFVKRVFDLTAATTIVVVGLPVWLLIAAVIKLNSPGPVFYRQTRLGRGGTPFGMLKFRSMYLDAEARLSEMQAENEASGPLFKMKDDPRVTPVGKWLRKFSVDEFPQLINVLSGEMSLVGPRPPLPHESAHYSVRDWRRLEVVPGMTGLWQVSGRSGLTFDEMVSLDIFYIENWSVALDMTLIVRTIPAVLLARGAY